MGKEFFYENYRDELDCPTCFYEENNSNAPHFHSAIELIYVTSGVLGATVSGKVLSVNQGELLVIPTAEIHRFDCLAECKDVVLMIPINYIPFFEKLFSEKTFEEYILRGEPAKNIYEYISNLAAINDNAKSPIIRGYTYLILGYVTQRLKLKNKPINNIHQIHIVVNYIEEHYADSITIGDIAKRCRCTESRMSHFFNEMMGCSFPDYLGQLRARKAAQLLMYEASSVTDAAMEAGFESLRTFYRVFKKNYGMTPLQFKREFNKNDQIK